MYLLIDGQALQTQSATRGIGRYSRNLIAGLRAVHPGWRIEVVQSSHLPPIDPDILTGCIVRPFDPPFFNDSDHADANERYFGDWLTSRGPDALLVLNFFEGDAWVPRFTGPRPPLFGVLYDLIPLLFPRQYLGRSLPDHTMYAARLRQMLAADGMVAISEACAHDFCRLVPPPRPVVRAIGGAADQSFGPHSPAALEAHRARLWERFGIERDFVLYVGGPDFRKNLHGALEAFAALPPERRGNLDLVVACFLLPDQHHALAEKGRALGIGDSLKLTGYVSDDELRALYQLCRVFFFPSLYEGLGLPVLEAMVCGAPVVAANTSSVPEFTGAASWLADPASTADLALALAEALAEPRDRRQAERVAHARSFTWERSAELACDLMTTVRPMPVPRQPRLAWVSPLPPVPCALAYYAAELLEHLADRYDIELVAGPNQPALTADVAGRHRLIHVDEVAARHAAAPYDLFVYHLGNTPLCLFALELLHRFPGLLALHDYHLGELVTSAMRARRWPATLAEELEVEGETELARRVRDGGLDERAVASAAALNRRILSTAEAVLVNSAWAHRRVREQVTVPVARVPLPVQVPPLPGRKELRRCLGLRVDAFVVAAPGLEESGRALPALLRAVHALPEKVRRRTRVLLLGPLTARQHRAIGLCAQQLGLGRAAIATPALSLGELASHARAADVWVQLAYPQADEPAGHLFRAMAAGTPCVVAERGAFAELPADAVWKLPHPETETEDLAKALAALANDAALRQKLGVAGAEFVRCRPCAEAPARIAALIDLTIRRREGRDAPWTDAAVQALAGCADPAAARAAIDRWTDLRAAGQLRLRNRRAAAGATDRQPLVPELLRA